jgi:hypothetical protein
MVNKNQGGISMKKKLAAVLIGMALVLGACTEADTVSENLSKEADTFKVDRRVVFFNGITDKYLLTIEGKCSLGNNDDARSLTVTCKTGEGEYKKHFLGLSDNVSFFVEQTESESVDPYHYKVIFRPESIIPDIDLQTSGDAE